MGQPQDWESLRTEFVTGEIATLQAFATAHNLSYSSVTQNSKGWLKEREEIRIEVQRAARTAYLKEKQVTAESQAEQFTVILDQTISQWHDLHDEYKKCIAGLKHKVPSRRHRAAILQIMRQIERSLIEQSKNLEVLSGRVSSRSESGKIQHDKQAEFKDNQTRILDKLRVIVSEPEEKQNAG